MTTYIVILAIYLIGMFVIGIYGRKYINNMEDFLVAGRRGTLLMVASSFMASHFGGGFVVGGAEYGAKMGIGGAWYGIACGLSYLVFGLVMSRAVYKMKQMTISDFLEVRYGEKVTKTVFAVMNILASIGIIGGQIMAGQRILQAVGLNGFTGALLATLIVIGYSTMSGFWGVLATDVVQIILGSAGIIVVMFTIFANGGASIMGSLSGDFFAPVPFTAFEFTMVVVPTVLYGFISQPSYQRVNASKTEKIAFKSCWLSGLLLIPLSFIPVIIGMYGHAVYPDLQPGVVFFRVIVDSVHPVVGGVLIAAVFAALMSTADSLLLGITANGVHDIYGKLINPKASEKDLVKVSYVVTAITGVLALTLALSFSTIIGLLSLVYSVLVATTLTAVLGGFLWKRATSQGAIASMIVGFTVFFLGRYNVIAIPYPHLVALIPAAAALVIGSLMSKPKDFDIQSTRAS